MHPDRHSKDKHGRQASSLKDLVLAYALGYVLLVTVTGLIGGISFYHWKQASDESQRINSLVEEVQAMRGALYRQMKEVFDAVFLGDTDAAAQYMEYQQQVQARLRALRTMAASSEENEAVKRLDTSYNSVRSRTDDIISDWKTYSPAKKQRVLDSELESGSLRNYELAFGEIERLLAEQQSRLQSRLALLSRLSLLLLAIPIVAAVVLLLWSRYALQRALVAPLYAAQQAATMISRGNLSHRVPETGARELVALSQSINQMAADLADSRQSLIQAERQATLAALVPVVAHNIRNPLASIRATAQVLGDPALPGEVREGLEGIIRTTDRLEGWTTSLLSYLHPLEPQLDTSDPRDLVDEVLRLLAPRLEAKRLRIVRTGWQADPSAGLDAHLIEQALQGLLANAIEASADSATIGVEISLEAETLIIVIEDEGPGIPIVPAAGPLAPGPSTKRFGTGLGIPFAMKVCEVHEGALAFENRNPSGTRVVMRIPLHANHIKPT